MSKDESSKLDSLIDTIYAAIENFAGLQFLNNEGAGLYALHSKANHSCDPNAEVAFPFNNNISENYFFVSSYNKILTSSYIYL